MESRYDSKVDVLNIDIRQGKYWRSIELPSGIVIDMARDGYILSIEILSASKIFLNDAKRVLEAAKA